MPDSDAVRVVAATRVRPVEVIDGGATTTVSLTVAGGGEACVLLPTGAMGEMLFLFAEALEAGSDGGPPNVPRG